DHVRVLLNLGGDGLVALRWRDLLVLLAVLVAAAEVPARPRRRAVRTVRPAQQLAGRPRRALRLLRGQLDDLLGQPVRQCAGRLEGDDGVADVAAPEPLHPLALTGVRPVVGGDLLARDLARLRSGVELVVELVARLEVDRLDAG